MGSKQFLPCSFSSKHVRSSTTDNGNIENEYIRNLQQQVYFLELEANYLYPFLNIVFKKIYIYVTSIHDHLFQWIA